MSRHNIKMFISRPKTSTDNVRPSKPPMAKWKQHFPAETENID